MTRLIKKYANRRLYDTVASKHVTLHDVKDLIIAGENVRILDDTSGEDITRPLLLQIIVEQEQADEPILPATLLSQLIRFYGNPMQAMMTNYLQQSVDTFVDQQRSIQDQMQRMMTSTPFDLMQRNMEAWQKMMGSGNAKDPKDD